MKRPEVIRFLRSFFSELKNADPAAQPLKPFFDLILSLKRNLPLSIPLLRELADFAKGNEGPLFRRIDRRYHRLCRLQEELHSLDLKKAAHGNVKSFILEDYVFSQIDFSRYRQMGEKDFGRLFPDGLGDFDDAFFKKNFRLGRDEIRAVIEGSYKKEDGLYKLQRENPLILSVMRTLETSLEDSPLLRPAEIEEELKNLLDFIKSEKIPHMELLYPLLVSSLDNATVSHEDGMTTRLFVSAQGELSGTFQPAGKAWTRSLLRLTP